MVHARGSQTHDTWGSINIVCARLVLPSGSSHSNTFVTINSQSSRAIPSIVEEGLGRG